jgi:branched-chain amino acid transport system permease protein
VASNARQKEAKERSLTGLSNVLQFLIAGIGMGAIYAIVGLGYMIIYNVTRVVNFAQGEFVMLGGMISATFWERGVSIWLSILIAVVITTLVGFLIYGSVIYPIRRAPTFTLILVTFGASIVIRGIATVIWGTDPKHLPSFTGGTLTFGGAVVNTQTLWVIGVCALMAAGLQPFFQYTRTGKAFRASAINAPLAELAGIRTDRIGLLAFGLSACLAAVAGAVMSPLTFPTVTIGLNLSVMGFMAAMIGGLDRIEGVVLGGIGLGILQSFAAGYVSSAYKEIIAIAVLLVVLAFRRQGILGSAHAGQV